MMTDDPCDPIPPQLEAWYMLSVRLGSTFDLLREWQKGALIATGMFRDGGHIGKFSDPKPYVIPRFTSAEAMLPKDHPWLHMVDRHLGKTGRVVIDEAHHFQGPNVDAFDYPDRHPARDLLSPDKMSDMTKFLLATGDKDFIDLETDRRFMVLGVDHADGPSMDGIAYYRDGRFMHAIGDVPEEYAQIKTETFDKMVADPVFKDKTLKARRHYDQAHPKRYRKGDR